YLCVVSSHSHPVRTPAPPLFPYTTLFRSVRARYNLAWVFTREKNFPAALGIIAEALALDKTGEYRERLLQKQSEVLAQLAVRNRSEEHTSELQSLAYLVCRLLLEKKKNIS